MEKWKEYHCTMRVALIAPSFFGYSESIIDAFNELGHSCCVFRDRPSESVVFKSIGRIDYSFFDSVIEKYFTKLLLQLVDMKPDIVLFVGGMSFCFTADQLSLLKGRLDSDLVLYLWDSLRNCQRVGSCLSFFDRAYSFDPKDCAECEKLELLPLFYSQPYGKVPLRPESGFVYDACFVGSVHQESKFLYVKAIVDQLRAEGASVFTHYYVPSRSIALLRKLCNEAYCDEDLRFDTLSRDCVVALFKDSKTIIDAPQSGQSGLTMRSIECVGSQRKLVTANPNIVDYDFFEYGQARYIPNADSLDLEFIKAEPTGIPDKVKFHYSIWTWSEIVLGITR